MQRCWILTKLELSRQTVGEKKKKTQQGSSIKIRTGGSELFHTDGRKDRHEAKSLFSQFCERT